MRGAIEGHQFAHLACHRDYVAGRCVVDEQSVFALADSKVRSLVDLRGQQLQLLIGHPDQHVAPVIAMRQTPHRRAEDVVLPPRRAGEKSASPKRVCQPERAAAIDSQQLRELTERDRLFGKRDRLQNGEAAIKTLYEGNLANFFLGHKDGSDSRLETLFPAIPGKSCWFLPIPPGQWVTGS